MWARHGWLGLGLVCWLLACGETKQSPPESVAGAGAAATSAGSATVGGSAAHAGSFTQGGSGEAPGGGGAGGSAGQTGRAGAAACVPVAHERPTPGALTGTFDSLVTDFSGVYKIDAAYEHSGDCASMCLTGTTFGPKTFGHAYLVVEASSAPPRYDIEACDSVDDCKNREAAHARVGAVDDVKSDLILFAQRSYVESPQGETCTGGSDDYWLIATAPKKIRVDVEQVRVDFPAYLSEASGLYGCASEDAMTAAQNEPCNALSVVDATRVE